MPVLKIAPRTQTSLTLCAGANLSKDRSDTVEALAGERCHK